eukprot:445736_1
MVSASNSAISSWALAASLWASATTSTAAVDWASALGAAGAATSTTSSVSSSACWAKNGTLFMARQVAEEHILLEIDALVAEGAKALVHDDPAMRATAAEEMTFILEYRGCGNA